MNKVNKIDEYKHFNELFIKSDLTSNKLQKRFILARKIQIISITFSTFVAIFSIDVVPWIFLVLIVLAAICAAFIWKYKPDQHWYLFRSIAESVKSASWQYMMKGEKFRPSVSLQESRLQFSKFCSNLLSDYGNEVSFLSSYDKKSTEVMDDVRNLSVHQRYDIYLKYRIEPQRDWYQRKSESAEKLDFIFNILTFILFAFGVLSVLFHIANFYFFDTLGTAAGSFFVTTALSLLGWVQIRNYSNLAASYAFTLKEINKLIDEYDCEELKKGLTDKRFSEVVQNSEAAFSREHTSWRARKQQI